jgi:hypothetical protein
LHQLKLSARQLWFYWSVSSPGCAVVLAFLSSISDAIIISEVQCIHSLHEVVALPGMPKIVQAQPYRIAASIAG